MGLSQAYLTSRMSGDAADRAASIQERSAQAAVDEQRRQFDLTRSDMAPWLETGRGALNALAASLGLGGGGGDTRRIDPNTGQPIGVADGPRSPDLSAFLASPDYQFALEQGQQAVERSAAAGGNLRSGNTLAALTRYGQGMASQQLGNYRNTLAGLAGVGQNSANTLGVLGAGTANSIGNLFTGAGNARASGILNSNVATQNAINQSSQNTMRWLSNMGWMGYGRG